MTPSIKVSFKHEGTVRDEGTDPEGKIHVYDAAASPGPIAVLWGARSDAVRLAELIGAPFNEY
jgi:hypothetical protein